MAAGRSWSRAQCSWEIDPAAICRLDRRPALPSLLRKHEECALTYTRRSVLPQHVGVCALAPEAALGVPTPGRRVAGRGCHVFTLIDICTNHMEVRQRPHPPRRPLWSSPWRHPHAPCTVGKRIREPPVASQPCPCCAMPLPEHPLSPGQCMSSEVSLADGRPLCDHAAWCDHEAVRETPRTAMLVQSLPADGSLPFKLCAKCSCLSRRGASGTTARARPGCPVESPVARSTRACCASSDMESEAPVDAGPLHPE